MKPYGYVYEIVNNINGKTYIGQRKLSLDTSWDDYYGSGRLIKQAIKKYGKENFSKYLLIYSYSREELNEKESFYIQSTINDKTRGSYNIFKGVPFKNPLDYHELSPEIKKDWANRISHGVKKSDKFKKAMNERKYRNNISNQNSIERLVSKKEEIIELYDYGFTIEELAKKYKITTNLMRDFLLINHKIHSREEAGVTAKANLKRKNTYKEKRRFLICKCCNEEFYHKNNKVKYCSSECRKNGRLSKNIDRDLLIIDLYVNKNKSTGEISEILKSITQPGVLSVLKRNNVPRKSHGFKSEKYLSKMKKNN